MKAMDWRALGLLLVGLLSADLDAQTQVPRVGVLFSGTAESSKPRIKVVTDGMRSHGYVDGKNLRYDMRFGDASPETTHRQARALRRWGLRSLGNFCCAPIM